MPDELTAECGECGSRTDGPPTLVEDNRCSSYAVEAPRVETLCAACYEDLLTALTVRTSVRVFSAEGRTEVRIDDPPSY
jgi:hypothetical protein